MSWKETYKLVIFDCDGTLVDSERLSNRLIADMMNELGIAMTEERSLRLFKGTHFELITNYVKEHIREPLHFDFEKEYRRRCALLFEKELKEVPGARRFIQKLSVPCCVASNGPHEKMESSLRVTGIDKLIEKRNIFSAYDLGKFKPDPALFLYAAAHFGVSADSTLVIEDTVPGIEAAQNAGMDVWAFYHQGINEEILKYDIPVYRDFTEIKI